MKAVAVNVTYSNFDNKNSHFGGLAYSGEATLSIYPSITTYYVRNIVKIII